MEASGLTSSRLEGPSMPKLLQKQPFRQEPPRSKQTTQKTRNSGQKVKHQKIQGKNNSSKTLRRLTAARAQNVSRIFAPLIRPPSTPAFGPAYNVVSKDPVRNPLVCNRRHIHAQNVVKELQAARRGTGTPMAKQTVNVPAQSTWARPVQILRRCCTQVRKPLKPFAHHH